jgi:hypothetical protein
VEDLSTALQTGAVQPFSLADLGLSDEEIAALNFGEASVTSPTGQIDTAEIRPFSLNDLGLTDEELGDLVPDEADLEEPEVGLGITEEELAGLGIGGMDWSAPLAAAPTPTGDPLAARLLELGRRQGYVDIADIIAGVENPEAEADRIEQIGQVLHEAGIQIRDGDEVIDLEANESDEEPHPGAATVEETAEEEPPELKPFTLSELGLSEEEIASLGLDASAAVEAAPAAPPAPAPAPGPAPAAAAPAGQGIDRYLALLEADPENHGLRLALARLGWSTGDADLTVHQYRQIIRRGVLLEDVASDLRDMLNETDDHEMQRRLHRLLGDAYTKQGRLSEAMDQYNMTIGGR